MAVSTSIPVNGAVLEWARKSARITSTDAAARLHVSPERLAAFESAERSPSLNQLRNMAKVYHRPLAALMMPEPVADEALPDIPDFRRPAVSAGRGASAALQSALVRARSQQNALRDIADDLGPDALPPYASLSLSPGMDPEISGAAMRKALGIDALSPSVVRRPEDFLRALVRATERLGVVVIQVQRVERDEMRGFSLGVGTYPLIALNGADWPRGKAYTLLHELAHVAFHSNGLCDLQQETDSDLERVCDEVAASALMPRVPFLQAASSLHDFDFGNLRDLQGLGSLFGASGEATLLRLVEFGLTDWDTYHDAQPRFREAYMAFRQNQKDEQVDNGPAPIFYQLKARDLGRPYINAVLRAFREEAISSRDVSQLLEVSFDKVRRLADTAGIEG